MNTDDIKKYRAILTEGRPVTPEDHETGKAYGLDGKYVNAMHNTTDHWGLLYQWTKTGIINKRIFMALIQFITED